MLPWSRCASLVAGLLLLPTTAAAQPADGMRLVYLRAPGAEGCPDEEALRDTIAAQLGGADPFSPAGARRMDIAIAPDGAAHRAQITLTDAAGAVVGSRELRAPTCAALIDDVATTVSTALRPSSPQPPAPLPPAAIPAPPPPAVSPPPSPPIAAPRPPRLGPRFQLAAAAQLAGGLAPALSAGFGGALGARWPSFSLSFEGRAFLPASGEARDGSTLRASHYAALVAPCAQPGWLVACGLLAAGLTRAEAGAARTPEAKTAPHVGIGARIGAEVPITAWLAAQVTGDVLVNLVRPTLRVDEEDLWSTAVVSAVGGARVVTTF